MGLFLADFAGAAPFLPLGLFVDPQAFGLPLLSNLAHGFLIVLPLLAVVGQKAIAHVYHLPFIVAIYLSVVDNLCVFGSLAVESGLRR